MEPKSTLSSPQSTLEDIVNRTNAQIDQLYNIALRLNNHADQVFGSLPATDQKAVAEPIYAGQLGEVYRALDNLSAITANVSEAATRNCTLA